MKSTRNAKILLKIDVQQNNVTVLFNLFVLDICVCVRYICLC